MSEHIIKKCPICLKELKTDDIVVMLGLAKITLHETSYDLSIMAQTISSHVLCVEAKQEPK